MRQRRRRGASVARTLIAGVGAMACLAIAAVPAYGTAALPPIAAYELHARQSEQRPAGAGPPAYSWASKPGVIAHATGRVRDVALTNSREAFEENYRKGVRIFEIDFLRTSDGVLVARHDWSRQRFERFGQRVPAGGVPTLVQFERALIRGTYHPLTVADVVALLRRYSDAWVMTDIKELSLRSRTDGLRQLSQAIGSDRSVRDRIIVQIYGESDYPSVRSLGFRNVVYTFYHLETSVSRALDFSEARHIQVVTAPSFMVDAKLVRQVRAHSLILATHTVNSPAEAAGLWRLGVRMLYTDALTPPGAKATQAPPEQTLQLLE